VADGCGLGERMLARHPHLMNFSCTDGLWVDGREPYLDYAVFNHRVFIANGAANIGVGENGADGRCCARHCRGLAAPIAARSPGNEPS
jgi:hypothetical protein